MDGRTDIRVYCLVSTCVYLVPQHPVVGITEWNLQLGLCVHQHLHPLHDVLVNDLPELQLARHVVVHVVDYPHLEPWVT